MTRLVILSILKQRPMHGYEIQQIIQEERMEQWVDILSGSIYFALNQMEKEGLIRADAEERTGNRLRKIYSVTDSGRAAYLELLREALATPPHSLKSNFSLALGCSLDLPAEERCKILRQNIRRLEELRQLWKAGQAIKSGHHPAIKTLFENDLAMIDHDLRFLQELLDRIESETGAGPAPAPRKATHLIIRTSGTYKGNPFAYEETVPVEEYEASQWWSWFKPERAANILRQVTEAVEGEIFTIRDPKSKSVTEIAAITQGEERS